MNDKFDKIHRENRHDVLHFLAIFTLAFLISFFVAYSPFFTNGATFVTNDDGRKQHFPVFVYVGRYLRKTVRGFLKGNFSIQLFDLSMGLGDDIIAFLNSLGGIDPLLLLSALVPAKNSENLYNFLAIFRLYLAGLSFSVLCRYFKQSWYGTLLGSLVYCFSGYALHFITRHPYFANPLILLPLLVIGTEKALRCEKSYVLIASTFYAALCGYYHMYQLAILMVIYVAVRFLDFYREKRTADYFYAVGRVLFACCLGAGLAAFILLPSVVSFLGSGRKSQSNFNAYNWKYYYTRLLKLIAPTGTESDLALAAIVVPAFILLFTTKGKTTLKALILAAFLIYMTPQGGFILNGFQYPSNRWIYGLVLPSAFTVTAAFPGVFSMDTGKKRICLCALLIYAVGIFSSAAARKTQYVLVGLFFLTAVLLVLIGREEFSPQNTFVRYEGQAKKILCLFLVIANVGVNGIYTFAPDQGNDLSLYEELGSEGKRLNEAPERYLEPYLLNNPEGRADSTAFTRNTAMVWQIPSTLIYSSAMNSNVTDFWVETENCGRTHIFQVYSTDQRTILNSLLSIKYQLETEKKEDYLPYGYVEIKKTADNRLLYENEYALPWGYTYDKAVSYEDIEALNGVQLQEVMLQAVALSSEEPGLVDLQDALSFEEKAIPYEIACKNCKWENDELKVSKENATITLNFSLPANSEGYLRISDFDIEGSGLRFIDIPIKAGSLSKKGKVESSLYDYNSGRKDNLVNLGYSEAARDTSCTITFPSKGTFKLADIELYALPMDNYPERVEALRAEPLENIQWGTNELTGTVDLSKDKILCVSVPYSKGWTATVDGEEVEILRGNYMFMCLPLTAGHHDIEFQYCSPGIKLGAVVTVCSVGILTVMLVRDKKKKKAGENNEI